MTGSKFSVEHFLLHVSPVLRAKKEVVLSGLDNLVEDHLPDDYGPLSGEAESFEAEGSPVGEFRLTWEANVAEGRIEVLLLCRHGSALRYPEDEDRRVRGHLTSSSPMAQQTRKTKHWDWQHWPKEEESIVLDHISISWKDDPSVLEKMTLLAEVGLHPHKPYFKKSPAVDTPQEAAAEDGDEDDDPFSNLKDSLEAALDNREMTDIALVCGSTRVPVHSIVMGLKSAVLRDKLESALEAKTPELRIKDMSPKALRKLVAFFYDEKFVLETEDEARQLLLASHKYEMPQLKKTAVAALVKLLTRDNALKMLQLAYQTENEELEAECKRAICQYVEEQLEEMKRSPQMMDVIMSLGAAEAFEAGGTATASA